MIHLIFTALVGAAMLVGGLFTPTPSVQYDAGEDNITLGATNFPTSLDSLTNPGATDSVATVSHSGQHSNANDAIEALEAKLGIGASTAVSNSVLNGTSAGVSSWSATPTLTGLTATNLLATGSSTLQNFTFVNATGTNATTTNSYATTASSTALYSTKFQGGGLSTNCNSSNFLQWTASTQQFGCGTGGSSVSSVSTTTVHEMATTTLRTSDGTLPSAPTGNYLITLAVASTTGSLTGDFMMRFNSDSSLIYTVKEDNNGVTANSTNNHYARIGSLSDPSREKFYAKIQITSNAGMPKFGTYQSFDMSTSTPHSLGQFKVGNFVWANQNAITRVDFTYTDLTNKFEAGTVITVLGW